MEAFQRPTEKMKSERRAHPRRPVNRPALITYGDGRATAGCRLVNISDGGALVATDHPESLPDRVTLYYDLMDEQRLEAVTAFCLVVRRSAHDFAVRFLSAPSPTALPGA